MFTLPPYMYDREAYRHPQVTMSSRFLLNKLHLAERLGYDCGPVGAEYDPDKTYCIRPIMNLSGMGRGGFYKFKLSERPEGMGNHPGYFFCEWFVGPSRFTEYVNDVPVYSFSAPRGNTHEFNESSNHIPMPNQLKGRSRYMLIEAIGQNIIEVSFRHACDNARQASIDDYRTIDSTYDPQDIEFGLYDSIRVPADTYRERGHQWAEIEGTRRQPNE